MSKFFIKIPNNGIIFVIIMNNYFRTRIIHFFFFVFGKNVNVLQSVIYENIFSFKDETSVIMGVILLVRTSGFLVINNYVLFLKKKTPDILLVKVFNR